MKHTKLSPYTVFGWNLIICNYRDKEYDDYGLRFSNIHKYTKCSLKFCGFLFVQNMQQLLTVEFRFFMTSCNMKKRSVLGFDSFESKEHLLTAYVCLKIVVEWVCFYFFGLRSVQICRFLWSSSLSSSSFSQILSTIQSIFEKVLILSYSSVIVSIET